MPRVYGVVFASRQESGDVASGTPPRVCWSPDRLGEDTKRTAKSSRTRERLSVRLCVRVCVTFASDFPRQAAAAVTAFVIRHRVFARHRMRGRRAPETRDSKGREMA